MKAIIKILLIVSALSLYGTMSLAEKPYPLDTCVVSGEKLGGDMGDPVILQYQGQEVRFCCPACKKIFLKDPEKYLKILADAKAKADAPAPDASK
jgi:hypothetical protein